MARTGRVLPAVVQEILKEGYFSALPPKSCGREQFGEAFVSRFIAMCRRAGGKDDRDEDVVATATALTAASVVDAYRRFVRGHLGAAAPVVPVEFVVAGGGAKNTTLMRHVARGVGAAGGEGAADGGAGGSGAGEGGGGVCAAGVVELERVAGECSDGHGGDAGRWFWGRCLEDEFCGRGGKNGSLRDCPP